MAQSVQTIRELMSEMCVLLPRSPCIVTFSRERGQVVLHAYRRSFFLFIIPGHPPSLRCGGIWPYYTRLLVYFTF